MSERGPVSPNGRSSATAEPSQAGTSRGRLLLLAKLSITVLLCVVIVWQADWDSLARSLRHADAYLVSVVFVCMVLCVTISTYKWQLLLRIHGAEFEFGWLHRLYFTSMFFNNFLPTSIGGDGYRVYRTLRNQRSKTSAFIAVFMERLSGIASLLLIGFFGGLIGYNIEADPLSRTAVFVGLTGMAVGIPLTLLVFRPRFVSWLLSLRKVPDVVRTLIDHLGDYRREAGKTGGVILVSFGFHFFTILWLMLLIHATGGSLEYYQCAVLAAAMSVVAVIPLSINGIGLVDGAFIYLAGLYGLQYETALTTALLQRGLMLSISLVGGLLYVLDKQRAPAAEAEGAQQNTALR